MTPLVGISFFAIFIGGVAAFFNAPAWVMAATLIFFLAAGPTYIVITRVSDAVRTPLRDSQ